MEDPQAAPLVPPAAASSGADVELPMSPEEIAAWWGRVDRALEARKPHEDRWEKLLKAYLPPTGDGADMGAINSNIHFRNTEQKKDTIYFRDPTLTLIPLEPLKDGIQGPDGKTYTAEDVVSIKQAVLSKLLGRDGVNLKRLAGELLFDILQPGGMAFSVIGYERDLVEVDQDVLDPMTGLPTGETQKVPVPIFEEWRWDHLSLKKGLIPHDFRSLRFDRAPWLGYKFTSPLEQAKREYKLPDDFAANATSDTATFKATSSGKDDGTTTPMVEGVVIWYYASQFDPSVTHRQLMRRLVLIKGLTDRAAKHTKSPYQTLDPDGRLSKDSMIGNPIHIFTLRDLSDSAYLPSDAAMTDPLVRQENTWASQDIALRDANIPRFLYDDSLAEAIKKLQTATVGEGAPVESGKLQQGIEKLIATLPKLEKAAADVQGRAAIRQMIAETLGLGANQGGSVNDKVLSATEISSANQTAGIRTKAEQGRFMDDLLAGVRKFDALVVRFADTEDYVTWEGQNGAKRMAQWNGKMLAARMAYDIVPDSQLDVDMAQKRAAHVQYANLTMNAPETNRLEALREMARDFGKDPSKMVQQPPPKQPEIPTPNISIASADLNPLLPQYANVYQVLTQQGIKNLVPPNPMALLNQPPPPIEDQHGGALEGSGEHGPVSKHAGQLTGNPVGRGPM